MTESHVFYLFNLGFCYSPENKQKNCSFFEEIKIFCETLPKSVLVATKSRPISDLVILDPKMTFSVPQGSSSGPFTAMS